MKDGDERLAKETLIFGGLRDIPPGWRLTDCAFGVFGAVPMWLSRRGRVVGWMFVFAVALLSGFGVYLGRFERWNSWDAVMNHFGLIGDAATRLHWRSALFNALFGVFLFTAYAMLYSLTLIGPAIHFTPAGPHSTRITDK